MLQISHMIRSACFAASIASNESAEGAGGIVEGSYLAAGGWIENAGDV